MSGFYGTPIIAPAAINTIQIENSDGSTLFAVVTGEETILTATADDIKIGKVAATDGGIVEGSDTKTYRTTQGSYAIRPGKSFSIPLSQYDKYDYTKFQAVISEFNTNFTNSVQSDKVSLNDAVYSVNSLTKLSDVTKNISEKSIDLNIINDTTKDYVIHYMTYKEE